MGWLIRQSRLPATSVGRRRWVRETDAEACKAEQDRWITYEEAAVILGISNAAVWPLVRAGKFKQRGPAGTKLPSLDRKSVLDFAARRHALDEPHAPGGAIS